MIKELLKGSGNWHGIKAGICPILGISAFSYLQFLRRYNVCADGRKYEIN